MIKVTRELLRRANSCYGAERENELIPVKGLTIREVAALKIPIDDKIFAICYASNAPDNALREFACWCARNALNAERKAGREPDPRSWTAVDVAERYARGEASQAELEAAWDAAYEDAFGAASNAASNAAYSAAFYAAYSTPSDSARRAIHRRQLKKLVDLLS